MNYPLPGNTAQIYFSTRHETHYAFTNVSSHPVNYQGILYLTAEHLFQAMKFLNHQPAIADLVRNSADPGRIAKRYDDQQRRDWPTQHLFFLEQVLLLKFTQYPGLKMELLATGNAQLIQENGSGQNEFGRVLMRVRSTLRGN